MKSAASRALTKGIRTFAQTAAAGLGTVTIVSLKTGDLRVAGLTAGLALATAGLAGCVAFLQNFAEALPDE